MSEGFILLSRAILDSDVFASQKLLKIWIWCLCKANFKDRSIPLKIGKGETIIRVKRGSFIFGRFKAEEELFIDGSTVYKSMNKLKGMNMINIESNNQYSIVTICKYDEYQQSDNYKVTTKGQPKDNQVTSKEQPSNTTKNANKDNNDNKELYIYSEKDFLERWKAARLHYDKKPTNLSKLTVSESVDFNNLLKSYSPKQIDEAIGGLFAQDTYKDTRLRPSHFLRLENFEKYLTCWQTNEVLFPKKLKPVERL